MHGPRGALVDRRVTRGHDRGGLACTSLSESLKNFTGLFMFQSTMRFWCISTRQRVSFLHVVFVVVHTLWRLTYAPTDVASRPCLCDCRRRLDGLCRGSSQRGRGWKKRVVDVKEPKRAGAPRVHSVGIAVWCVTPNSNEDFCWGQTTNCLCTVFFFFADISALSQTHANRTRLHQAQGAFPKFWLETARIPEDTVIVIFWVGDIHLQRSRNVLRSTEYVALPITQNVSLGPSATGLFCMAHSNS